MKWNPTPGKSFCMVCNSQADSARKTGAVLGRNRVFGLRVSGAWYDFLDRFDFLMGMGYIGALYSICGEGVGGTHGMCPIVTVNYQKIRTSFSSRYESRENHTIH